MENSNPRKTMLEIQAEQEQEQRQRLQTGRGAEGGKNSSPPVSSNYLGTGGGGGRSNNYRQNDSSGSNRSNYTKSWGGQDGGGGGRGGVRRGEGGADDRGRGGSSNGRRFGGGGGGGFSGGNTRRGGSGNNKNTNSGSNAGFEQGIICSLKDGFGFIHCADRPDQVFFHFSELRDGLKGMDLKINDEVQFRINEPPESQSGGPSTTEKKLVAVHVTRVPEGTNIVWAHPDTSMEYPIRGIVIKIPTGSGNQSNGKGLNKNNDNFPEGLIRILPPNFDVTKSLQQQPDMQQNDSLIVRFVADEYDPQNNCVQHAADDQQHENMLVNNSNFSGIYNNSSHPASCRAPPNLSKGDIVEIKHIVIDRRTKERYAKKITIVMTEKQRHFQEQEAKLLATASTEVGVITTVKGEYGFLKSNQRHEEIYFHFSNIHGDENEGVPKLSGENYHPLKEGQEMKFLVVTEGDDPDAVGRSGQRRRVSARQVQLQPTGSVTWHDVLAQGVTGVVVECPQPIDSGHPLETQGKVRLHTPIRIKKKHTFEEAMEEEVKKRNGTSVSTTNECDDEFVTCTEVYIWSKDSPGGNYSYRGGSSVGLYIQNGDTLLFDVIRDYIGDGGTCRAAPTRYLVPRVEEQEESHLEPDEPSDDKVKAIRLVSLSLAGRAEGLVSAIKDNNSYGFLQFAERNVDVHFKSYQILPDDLQADLRRNMGLPETVKMDVGSEVQFDISVHGTIAAHSTKQGAIPYNTKNGKNKRGQIQPDRENLKAQRILFIPQGTIAQTFTLAQGVQGRVSKQEAMQPFVGTIELDIPLYAASLEERHPLVAKSIKEFMENPFDSKIVYHDIQSPKEEDVIQKLVEVIGKGKLKFSLVDKTNFGGLVCIEKVPDESFVDGSPTGDEPETITNTTQETDDASHGLVSHDDIESNDGHCSDGTDKKETKKSIPKQKCIKAVRFDKNSMSLRQNDTIPPSLDDIVSFDAIQSRRTGHITVSNLVVTQRYVPEITNTGVETLGLVKEVTHNSNIVFLYVPDKTTEISELLLVALSDITMPKDNIKLQKGDAIKFIIGRDARNGKYYPLNAAFHESKDVLTAAKAGDHNPCKGIVLLKLTKNTIPRSTESEKKKIDSTTPTVGQPIERKSRWDNVKSKGDDTRLEVGELGCILLTEDSGGLFKANMTGSQNGNEENNAELLLYFKRSHIAEHVHTESKYPQRGDLVSFNKTRNANGVRDIRILTRAVATLIRGTLEGIQRDNATAKFVVASALDPKQSFDVSLKDIISCDSSLVKEKEIVEGVLYDNKVFGICRYTDLYVDSTFKITKATTERPKLNLTVKKDRGGTIVAQSRMAKGPDGETKGFSRGWTKRLSAFSAEFVPPTDDS